MLPIITRYKNNFTTWYSLNIICKTIIKRKDLHCLLTRALFKRKKKSYTSPCTVQYRKCQEPN